MNSLEKKVAEKKKREQEYSFNLDNLPPIETPKTIENTGFSSSPSVQAIPSTIKNFPNQSIVDSNKNITPQEIKTNTNQTIINQKTEDPITSINNKPHTTLNSLKKTYKAQTLSISTKNLALLDVVSSIKNESQKDFLDEILNEYFNKQNYDFEILKLVQNKIELIESTLHKN